MDDCWIWVTQVDNGKFSYNGKSHNKILRDALVEPKPDIQPGDHVMVIWETGKKKFWNAVVADATASSERQLQAI